MQNIFFTNIQTLIRYIKFLVQFYSFSRSVDILSLLLVGVLSEAAVWAVCLWSFFSGHIKFRESFMCYLLFCLLEVHGSLAGKGRLQEERVKSTVKVSTLNSFAFVMFLILFSAVRLLIIILFLPFFLLLHLFIIIHIITIMFLFSLLILLVVVLVLLLFLMKLLFCLFL